MAQNSRASRSRSLLDYTPLDRIGGPGVSRVAFSPQFTGASAWRLSVLSNLSRECPDRASLSTCAQSWPASLHEERAARLAKEAVKVTVLLAIEPLMRTRRADLTLACLGFDLGQISHFQPCKHLFRRAPPRLNIRRSCGRRTSARGRSIRHRSRLQPRRGGRLQRRQVRGETAKSPDDDRRPS